jgi:hypothetical protein
VSRLSGMDRRLIAAKKTLQQSTANNPKMRDALLVRTFLLGDDDEVQRIRGLIPCGNLGDYLSHSPIPRNRAGEREC